MDGSGERVTRRLVLGALAGAGVCGVLGSGTAAAAGGDKIWDSQTGSYVKSSPTVADGTVFVGSFDDSVYALDAGVAGSSEGSRALLGTLSHHGDWIHRGQQIDITPWSVRPSEGFALGGVGAVAALGAATLRSSTLQNDETDNSTETRSLGQKLAAEPGLLLAVIGVLLSTVGMTALSPVGTYDAWTLLRTSRYVTSALTGGVSIWFPFAVATILGWALVPFGLLLSSSRYRRSARIPQIGTGDETRTGLPLSYSVVATLPIALVALGAPLPWLLAVPLLLVLVLVAFGHLYVRARLGAPLFKYLILVIVPGSTDTGMPASDGTPTSQANGGMTTTEPHEQASASRVPADRDISTEQSQQTGAGVGDEHPAYRRASSYLDRIESTLDAAQTAIDEHSPEQALSDLDDVATTLDDARKAVAEHELDGLADRLSLLERRHDQLRARIDNTRGGIPTTIPTTPRRSLSYDDIERGEAIGQGGNADVFRGTVRTGNGTTVTLAVKEPRMSGTLNVSVVERMMEEAETWQKLDDHDHIVSVVDYDSTPVPWIAMEYMNGGHLGQWTDEMEFEQKLWTAIAVTQAVRHAHRRGVAHLDLKPENVLLRSVENAWDVPKVADWGLSKHLLEHSKSVEGITPLRRARAVRRRVRVCRRYYRHLPARCRLLRTVHGSASV